MEKLRLHEHVSIHAFLERGAQADPETIDHNTGIKITKSITHDHPRDTILFNLIIPEDTNYGLFSANNVYGFIKVRESVLQIPCFLPRQSSTHVTHLKLGLELDYTTEIFDCLLVFSHFIVHKSTIVIRGCVVFVEL